MKPTRWKTKNRGNLSLYSEMEIVRSVVAKSSNFDSENTRLGTVARTTSKHEFPMAEIVSEKRGMFLSQMI
jgi:hypothetical protein